jgi:hypothetical protein
MANAFVRETNADVAPSGSGFVVTYLVIFSGTDVLPNGVAFEYVELTLSGGETPQQLGTLISNAVVQRAINVGLTVVRSNMTLPQYQKG